VQVVEGMKKTLLGLFFAGDELYVVEEEDIYTAVFVPEVLGPALSNGADELVGELFGGYIHDPGAGSACLPANGMQEVSFPQSHPAVNEQRIIAVARITGYSLSRGVCQAIAGAHQECVECVPAIELWWAGSLTELLIGERGRCRAQFSILVTQMDLKLYL